MADIALVADGDDILASQQNAIANALNGPWSTYTPDIFAASGSPVIGSGSTVEGRYKQIASGLIIAEGVIIWGTSPSNGSGDYQFHLPVAAEFSQNWLIGHGYIRDAGTENYACGCVLASSTRFYMAPSGAGGNAFADSSSPVATYVSGDSIRFCVTYEPA